MPALQVHKARRLARVRLNGHDIYLGPANTDEAADRYHAIIDAWIAGGRQWPIPRRVDSVDELSDLYYDFAQAHFVKAGRPTSTVAIVRRALEELYRSGVTDCHPGEFGPRRLRAFQVFLAAAPDHRFARKTINELSRAVVGMFRWAVEEQLVPAHVWTALTAIRPLRQGRSPAPDVPPPREGRTVRPAPRQSIDAVRTRVPAAIAAMIDLQLATGMRPCEVIAIRRCEIFPTECAGVMVYLVDDATNKLAHRGIRRRVLLGPRAMEIIAAAAAPGAAEFIFSPRRSERARNAERRRGRTTTAWPSHDPDLRRTDRRRPRHGDHYTTDSYRRAVERACVAAGVPRWTPNQLRHNAATEICRRESLEVARLLLGHLDIRTTLRYVDPDDARAIEAVLRHG